MPSHHTVECFLRLDDDYLLFLERLPENLECSHPQSSRDIYPAERYALRHSLTKHIYFFFNEVDRVLAVSDLSVVDMVV